MPQGQGHGPTTFQTDGKPHPHDELIPGLTVVARWRGSRILETVLARKDGRAGRVTYEVSADGKTLTSRTSGDLGDQLIIFDRTSLSGERDRRSCYTLPLRCDMGRRLSVAIAAFLVTISIARLLAQTQAEQKPLAFEVASIKPSAGLEPPGAAFQPGGRFRAINADVFSLIALSYAQGPLPFFPSQIFEAPDWTRTEHFDIIAKVSDDLAATDPVNLQAKVPALVRRLLEDRFRLTVRHEQREMPIYVLQFVGKDGAPGSYRTTHARLADQSQRLPPGTVRRAVLPRSRGVTKGLSPPTQDRVERTHLQLTGRVQRLQEFHSARDSRGLREREAKLSIPFDGDSSVAHEMQA